MIVHNISLRILPDPHLAHPLAVIAKPLRLVDLDSQDYGEEMAGNGLQKPGRIRIFFPPARVQHGLQKFPSAKYPALNHSVTLFHLKYKMLWLLLDTHYRQRYFAICGP